MSGKKEWSIIQSEWFRRRVRRPLADLLLQDIGEAVRSEQEAALLRDVQVMREQQERSQRMLATLRFSEAAREQEEATSRALAGQISRLEERLGSEHGALRDDLLATIAEQESAWREGLRQERRQRQRLADNVGELMHDRAKARQAAESRLSDAQAERDLIAATLPHERYVPGALAALDRKLSEARKNFAEGHSEAALTEAGRIYHDLSDLRLELTLRHSEWLELRRQAADKLILVRELIRHSGRLSADSLDADGGDAAEGAQIDIDHWSDGQIRRLQDEVQQSLDQVTGEPTEDAPPLTIDQLRNFADRRAPQLRQQVEDAVDLAQQRVLASQMRANIAELVAAALETGFAYEVSSGDYEAGDKRGAFSARLAHLSGGEVVVHVRPAGEHLTDSQLEVLSYDEDSPQRRRERALAITRRLRDSNLPVPAPTESSDVGPRPEPAPSRFAAPAPATAAETRAGPGGAAGIGTLRQPGQSP
jgi:hypothetical protein